MVIKDGGIFTHQDESPAFSGQGVVPASYQNTRAPARSVDTVIGYYGVFDEQSGKFYLLEVKGTENRYSHMNRRPPGRRDGAVFASGRM